MSDPKTTTTGGHGILGSQYRADDGNGHVGWGYSKEHANDALKHAQANDNDAAEHDPTFDTISGWDDD